MNDIQLVTEKPHPINYVVQVEEQKKKLNELSLESISPNIEQLPTIKIIPGALPEMTTQAEELLMNNTTGVFQRAGQLVRIITEAIKPKNKGEVKRSDDSLTIASVDALYLAETLSKLAKW
jgi:hypothetical protein